MVKFNLNMNSMKDEKEKRITDFLFELGTMRKIPRAHRQTLLTDDMSDNIATHSYRVTMIAWFLAKMEEVEPYKVVMMSLMHDFGEIRTNDHNWIHKRYMKVFDEQVKEEQLGDLPYNDLQTLVNEYDKRESKESLVAKDADILDQVLLLKEYAWQGNREAEIWLHGKSSDGSDNAQSDRRKLLKTESAKLLFDAMMDRNPSDWWNNLWTHKNR